MTVYKTMVLDYESNQASEVDQAPKPLLLVVHYTQFEPGLCLSTHCLKTNMLSVNSALLIV